MPRFKVKIALALLIACLGLLSGCGSTAEKKAHELLEALQKKDMNAVVILSSSYHNHLADFKKSNPQDTWQKYTEQLKVEDIKDLRDSQDFLPKLLNYNFDYKIIGSKKGSDQDNLAKAQKLSSVDAAIEYKTIGESPVAKGRHLQKATARISLDPDSGFFSSINLVDGSLVFWNVPVPKMEDVKGKWRAIKKEAYTLGGGAMVGFTIEFFDDNTVMLPSGKGTWTILKDGLLQIDVPNIPMQGEIYKDMLTINMPKDQGMVIFQKQ